MISVGGFNGCSIGAVTNAEGLVENADFRINNTILTNQSGFYADTSSKLIYAPGTNYTLNVSHMNQTIATGTAVMPSIPTITNLNNLQNHNLNSSLNVTWQAVQNASSIQVTISGNGYDPLSQEYIQRNFESNLISPSSTSYTIPDTLFSVSGEYMIGIIAYHGINPGFDISNVEQTGYYSKSYNMSGAAGVFIAASLSSEDGELITVGDGMPKRTPRKSFKDYVIEKHKRYFGNPFLK